MSGLKKTIYWILAIAIVAAIVFILINNKKQIDAETRLASEASSEIAVHVVEAKTERITTQIEADGVFMPYRFLPLISETQGEIVEIYKEKGDYVRKGQLIARVDDEMIKANVLVAEANYEQMEKDLKRFEKLIKKDAITLQQYEKAKIGLKKANADLITARKHLKNTKIEAPVSGTITNRPIELGLVIGGGTKICEIVNIDKLKMTVKVAENEVLKINEGMTVRIKPDVYNDVELKGTVTAVGVMAGKGLKYDVDIELNNSKEHPLKAGMYATVIFPAIEKESLVIERKALTGSIKNPTVFVVKDNKAELRELITGTVTNNKIEVLRGIDEGDKVVVSGQINLKDGIRVSIK